MIILDSAQRPANLVSSFGVFSLPKITYICGYTNQNWKIMNKFFMRFLPLMAAAMMFAACDSDETEGIVPEVDTEVTYTVSLGVVIAGGYLDSDLGIFKIDYLDADGATQSVDVTSSTAEVSVGGLEVGDEYKFEMYFEKSSSFVAPTENVSLSLTRTMGILSSDGSVYTSSTVSDSETIEASRVEEYIDGGYTLQTYSGTITE